MTAAFAPPRLPDLLGTAPSDLLPDERHDSTPAEAQDRADRLHAGIVSYARMRQDIADAYACRDWLALGYASWYEYVEGEFGELLAQLGRGERQQAIGDLRQQGMSTRQIASATGIGQSQVRRDLAQVSPDGSPGKVTGSDGKAYAATRPAPQPAQTPEPAAAAPSAVAGSGINDRPVDEAAPASTTPTDPRAGESPAAGFAAGSGAGDRPWCGAARELGGQQPCPIAQPCPDGTCAIGDDAEPDEEEIGSEYRTDPAERISAVAEVAPEFVKPVEPEPAPKPTLTLVPDEDERRLAEQRDARALLSRGVNLLAPASWKEDHFQAWIKHMGGEDEELAALKERAAAAIAVLTRVIEEAGR